MGKWVAGEIRFSDIRAREQRAAGGRDWRAMSVRGLLPCLALLGVSCTQVHPTVSDSYPREAPGSLWELVREREARAADPVASVEPSDALASVAPPLSDAPSQGAQPLLPPVESMIVSSARQDEWTALEGRQDAAVGDAARAADDGRGNPVSLDLRDADIRDALRLLGEVGRVDIVAAEDVRGTVTIHLEDQPWQAAFEAIVTSLNLGWHRMGSTIRVAPASVLQQQAQAAIELRDREQQLAPLGDEYLRVSFAKASDLAMLLSGATPNAGRSDSTRSGSFLSDRGLVIAEATTNTLIIRDTDEARRRIRTAVRELDVPAAQVLIESRIVEASADLGRKLGIQWAYTQAGVDGPDIGGSRSKSSRGVPFIVDLPAALPDTAGNALDLGFGSIDSGRMLDLRLTALEQEGEARIVSRPRITTLNNTAATIKSLTIIRVKLPAADTVVTGDRASVSARSVATEKIETGIILVVTPQVAADGRIGLEIFAKSSQADFSRAVDGIPTETSREASTRVVVADGETVVLGGIYSDRREKRDEGVPYLREIPGLRWLFEREDSASRREDLLVFLTPTIVPPAGLQVARVPTAQ